MWQLPAAETSTAPPAAHAPQSIALLPGDPLAQEAFCLVLSAQFGVVLTLDSADRQNSFQFSFDPKVVWQAWQTLRARVAIAHPTELPRLDALAAQFMPVEPHYSVVMEFGQRLLAALPQDVAIAPVTRATRRSASVTLHRDHTLSNPRDHKLDASMLAAAQRRVEPNPKPGRTGFWDRSAARSGAVVGADIELLQALSHGVRTPLATIRTLTRLLMKRRDMQPDALRHLEKIDRECTDQIDRFDLIFRAVELETGSSSAHSQALAPISLGQLFQTNIPRWQRQAERHNLTIDVQVPQKLPAVVSDPAVLDRILTELVENLARNLPAKSHLEMQVLPAGDRLKLQLRCQRPDGEINTPVAMDYDELLAQGMSGILSGLGEAVASSVSVGQLLTFQPETGNLSLNLNVTKNLFQAIGGKLVVRQRPRQGEFATIFLPLALKL
jgi:signal transduction histidine kinase